MPLHPDPNKSSIVDCYLIARDLSTILAFDKEGKAIVRMESYLICPKEMFTKHQIDLALKKYVNKRKKQHDRRT